MYNKGAKMNPKKKVQARGKPALWGERWWEKMLLKLLYHIFHYFDCFKHFFNALIDSNTKLK